MKESLKFDFETMFGFSREHRKNTHKFWWENKADPKFRDKFIFTEEESER